MRSQAERYLHTCFNIVMYPGYIELAEALIDLVPGDWPKVMLQTTGAEAVENAIKVARRATGRRWWRSRTRFMAAPTWRCR